MEKKFLIAIVSIILLAVSFSCLDDEDSYSLGDVWISLGMVQPNNTASGFTILCDNGDTLVPITSSVNSLVINDYQRVLVNYTIMDEVDNSKKKFWVKFHNIQKVLYKKPIELTSANADSIGNDAVEINDIWMTKNKLNIEFSYKGGEKTHFINLVYAPDGLKKTPVQFEFRHNNNGDRMLYDLKGLVSFDLSSMKQPGKDSIAIEVKYTDFNSATHTLDGIYKY
jgi:hypothetical protein